MKDLFKDHLFRHSVILMVASQVGNVSNLAFHMMMGRLLIPAEYGVLVTLLNTVQWLGMPLGALGVAFSFFSARFSQESRVGDIWTLIRDWVIKLAFVVVLLVALGGVFHEGLAEFFHLPERSEIVITLMVVGVSFFPPVFQGSLMGLQAFVWNSVSAQSWGVFRLLFAGAFVCGIARSASWALVGQGLAILVSLLLGFIGLKAVTRGGGRSTRVDEAVFAYCWGSLLVLACFGFLMNADMLMVKRFFSAEAAGFYARASTIAKTIIFLPMPIAVALFPKVVSGAGLRAGDARLLARAIGYAALLVAGLACLCSLFPQWPLGVMYKDWQPTPEMKSLVRAVIWAMSPLALAFLLLYFELAQNRFRVGWGLGGCAALYVVGVGLWHQSVFQVIVVLGTVNALALVALAWELRHLARAPETKSPP